MAYGSAEAVKRKLIAEGVDPNVAGQEAGYLYDKYSDPGEDIEQVIAQSIPSYLQRSRSGGERDEGGYSTSRGDPAVTREEYTAPRRPAEDRRDIPSPRPGPQPFQPPTFQPPPLPRPTGAELNRLNRLFDQINTDLLGAGRPVVDVPGINLNEDIDASLLSLMRGTDASTLETDEAIRRLVQEATIGSPESEARRTKRMLTATENAQLAQQGLLEQLRAQLADAGVIGVPGVPQGLETAGARRATERVAVPFSQALRDIDIDESQQAETRQMNALQLATGWSSDKAQRVLQASAAGTDRQRILSEIALETLQTNQAWNAFLATFGLEREKFLQDVRSGNLDRIGGIINSFQQFLAQVRGGFIGND
mgnify:CR=1 FL=1